MRNARGPIDDVRPPEWPIMPIVVHCRCGKKFKAKDKLAGKKVRCPGCDQPLRIPDADNSGAGGADSAALVGAGSKTSSAGKRRGISKADAEAALLKYEVAQQRKQVDAEAEAAYRQEQNKLIESYDQLTGRYKEPDKQEPKKRKGEFTEGPIKKPTVFTKIADAFAVVFGTLLAKYLIIAILVAGGAVGSAFLVKKIMSYTSETVGQQTPKEERIKQLEVEARTAIANGQLMKAKKALDEIIGLDPAREQHRTYRMLKADLDKAFSEK